MNRTEVYIMLAGADVRHKFPVQLDEFLNAWTLQTESNGFFEAFDIDGALIRINPSQCGVIKISKCY